MMRLISCLGFLLCALCPGLLAGELTAWRSEALDCDIQAELLTPTAPPSAEAVPLAVYLKNLASPRVGTEPDEDIVASLRADGFLVLCLEYKGNAKARFPFITADIAQLRQQLQTKKLLAGRNLDLNHSFILPAGHRVLRNLVYYRDGARVLGIDLIYPSKPSKPVGTILEFSCDNTYRMGNYSLYACNDTLLEGLATEGCAVAMADHPVAPDYKGHDPMPDCARKIKAAVRLLRAEMLKHGGNGRIAPVGFSRGSGMALMLATTEGMKDFDGFGEVKEGDSSIQGAVILSGRFSYLDLLPNDKMIPRYERWWGKKAEHEELWRLHGALDYLKGPTIPLFLSINSSEGPDALHQMDVLRKRLTELGSPAEFIQEKEPRGHKVPHDLQLLQSMNDYLQRRLMAK
jgi:hypothetical protein